jgi:hypothetical protein
VSIIPQGIAFCGLGEAVGPARFIAGYSLHYGLNAPSTASQASVPGVASKTQSML